MPLKPYVTHTVPPLVINPPKQDEEDGLFVVTLVGSSIKELCRTNLAKATSVFKETVAHYEERKRAET